MTNISRHATCELQTLTMPDCLDFLVDAVYR